MSTTVETAYKTSEQPQASVATAGEALIDLVSDADGRFRPCLGGAVYNFTRALAKQGRPSFHLNPFSSDRFGHQLKAQLVNDGAQLLRPVPVDLPTSLAVVALDSAGKPDYAFYREGVADRDVTSRQMIEQCSKVAHLRLVATGCLALAPADSEKYITWLSDSRSKGILVAVDANLRPSVIADLAPYRTNVLKALSLADIIKLSDDDVDVLYGLTEKTAHRGKQLSLARALFDSTPAQYIVLTLGAEGACLLRRHSPSLYARETARLAIVDTVGAGDCFFAGFINGLLANNADEQALARAIASASWCVQQSGCVPANNQEIAMQLSKGTIRIDPMTT